MDWTPTLPQLPWPSFGPTLVDLLTAAGNKLDREWPAKWVNEGKAAFLLPSLARTVENTFHTIKVLSADKPTPPITREDALSVGPLARTILDSLFLIIFLFDDLPGRATWYFKGGWREMWEEQQMLLATYGGDANWKEWLDLRQKILDEWVTRLGLSATEAADPTKHLRYWPTPGRMIRDGNTSPQRIALMKYLDEWYYGDLSSESHLSLPGLVMRSMALDRDQDQRIRDWRLDKQRSDNMLRATVLATAFVSEIDIECRYGFADRLKYVWGVLAGYFNLAKDLYDRWYASRL